MIKTPKADKTLHNMTSKEKLPITKSGDESSSQHWRWGAPIQLLLGQWDNVFEGTKLIQNVFLEEESGAVYITVWGKGPNGPINWGKQQCHIYYEAVDSNAVEGLTVNYDFDFMENLLCFNVKKGVLTIQMYSRFKDKSNRQNYFGREFFTKRKD